jgi:hypothetical protein
VSVWVYNSFLLSLPTVSQPHLMLISVPLTSVFLYHTFAIFFSINPVLWTSLIVLCFSVTPDLTF